MNEDNDNPMVEFGGGESRGDVRAVLPFSRLMEMVGVADEREIVEAIEEDSRVLLELGLGSYAERYAEAVDFRKHPLAREAALRAHAQALQEIRGIEAGKAAELAARAVDFAASSSRTPPVEVVAAGGSGASNARSRPGTPRAAFTTTIAIPIVLVLTFLFGSGFAVATLYWLGYVSSAQEIQLQQQVLAQEADRLAKEAESIAEAKNRAAEDAVAYIDELMIAAIEENMEEVHLTNAFEILMATEEIAQRFKHDPDQLQRISKVKLDELVMPTLRLVYRVDELGGEDIMQQVRELLILLHDRSRDESAEGTRNGPEQGGFSTPPAGAEGRTDPSAVDRAAGGLQEAEPPRDRSG